MIRPAMSSGNPNLGRRGFLQIGAAGWLGLSLGDVLAHRALADPAAPAPRAKNVIMIFLNGGPATIDMWDMKPEAPEKIRGEFQPIATAVPGVQVCEHLPRLAKSLDSVCLVRSLEHTIAEHTQGVAYVMSGNRPNPSFEYPSLGSLGARLLPRTAGTPSYVTIGSQPASGAGALGAECGPFEVSLAGGASDRQIEGIGLPEGFSVADLERRRGVLARLDARLQSLDAGELPGQLSRFQQQAFDILRSDKVNVALDVERETQATREQFGPGPFGRSVLAARRLIEAGAQFVTVGLGDWDTHANNFARLRGALLPQLDQGLSTLVSDLAERGLLDETILYCTGEFGRTPSVNDAAGRDHWARAMTALVAGGAFPRGGAFGATDGQGSEVVDNSCSPDDLAATIFHQLGFSPAHQVVTRNGRPVALFRHGRVLNELMG